MFFKTSRGVYSTLTKQRLKRRSKLRAAFRLRNSAWLNHVYGWSFLTKYYAGFGLKTLNETRLDSLVQDNLKISRFWEHLKSHPSSLVRGWVEGTKQSLESPVLSDASKRLAFMFSTLRLRALRERAIYTRQIETITTRNTVSWFG